MGTRVSDVVEYIGTTPIFEMKIRIEKNRREQNKDLSVAAKS